jgi:hypothetical protein
MEPLTLHDQEYERYQVVAALNEGEAQKIFPPRYNQAGEQLPVIPPGLVRGVTQAVARATIGRTPPQAEMHLGDMLDWIASQPEFTDDSKASPGPRGGKQAMLQIAIHEYRKWGTMLYLEIEPSLVGDRYYQSKIQHHLERLPEQQREGVRMQLEGDYGLSRQRTRQQLGVPDLQIGSPVR